MSFLDNIPIKRKLIMAIMLTSGIVLLLMCAAFTSYEIVAFRRSIRQNLSTMAEVIAANSTAALAFQNEADAVETLSALRADRHITAAALYDKKGKLFAKYPRSISDKDLPASPGVDGYQFRRDSLILFQPVQAEKRLGTLYVESDVLAIYERTQLYVIITLLVLAGSAVIAFSLSNWLQTRIARPILELAGAAKIVSEKSDYAIRAKKFGRDELGQLTDSFNGMLQQIQERDRALSEKEERLRLALQASRTGVWDWNIGTGKVTWDEFVYPLFGLERGAFRGTKEHFVELIHKEDQQSFQAIMQEAIDHKTDFIFEFRVIKPDGILRHLVSRGRAFYDDGGKPTRIIGIVADITERKQTDKALRESEEKYRNLSSELEQRVQSRTAELAASNKELESFTYSVSHDLRAPLRHIHAYSQLLGEEAEVNKSATMQNYARRIGASAKNMGRLVDDLLNLSRVGKQELTRQRTPLRPIVDEVINLLRPETEGRNIEWRIGMLPIAECDPGLMKQVFVNLISNAVKYSRPREQAIIEIDKAIVDGCPVIFIRDNGVGFNMKYSQKLFGVFERLHLAEEFEGTGVGLATVARIIQKHHGRIWAEAEENKGATFYFTFPGIK